MTRHALFLAGFLVTTAALAAPEPLSPEAGKRAFVDVARVLQSPRCQNCHPVGDAPLQSDRGLRHAMNITRTSAESGLPCATCHQERNVAGGPPGAPRWGLPPKDMPMVFEGRSVTALCEQLKDPERNGHKSLTELRDHVAHDPLVLWGWSPGAKRTLPPLTHPAFVTAFDTWLASGATCP